MSQPGAPGQGEPLPDIEEADPGGARARTELAWTRSATSFAAIGVVILKFRPLVGVPILIFSAIVWFVGHVPRDQSGVASKRVLLVTVAVTVLAVAALVLTIAGHGTPGLHM